MRIEKISDKQIRCTLTQTDLQNHHINIGELAYGSEKARSLFQEMLTQASKEFNFHAENIPLMIEAVPLSGDSLVLVITKVEDPDELDTRFSKFAPAIEDDDSTDDESEDIYDNPAGDVLDLINDMSALISQAKKDAALQSDKNGKSITTEYEVPDSPITRCFAFKDIDDIIRVSHICEGICSCSSSLYKTSENLYYLMFTSKDNCNTEINRLCNIISEYADAVKITPSSASYFQEHYDTIIKEQVFEKLCNI